MSAANNKQSRVAIGMVIEAESVDGAWEPLLVVRVNRQGFYATVTDGSFGPLPSTPFFRHVEENELWRRRNTEVSR